MLASMICWGSWANTQKLVPGFPFQLFYWDYVLGVVLIALLSGLTLGAAGPGEIGMVANLSAAGGGAILYAVAAGAVFNLANLLLVAAIAIAGLAVAFPVGIGLALVVGAVTNYVLAPTGYPPLLFGGILLIVLAIAIDSRAFRLRDRAAPAASSRGLRLALVCGLLMGSFYPLIVRAQAGPTGLNSYAVTICFAAGVVLCAIPVNLLLMRRPITADPPTDFATYLRAPLATHLSGVLGGMIWGAGLVTSLLAAAAALVGPAVSYSLGQGATMVSAAWGVFVWREFAGAPRAARVLLLPMFALFGAGLALVALSPLYGN